MNKTLVLAMVVGFGGMATADGKDAKAPAPKAPDTAKTPAPKAMEMPKAPKEVADMVKGMEGTWKCTGKGYMPDGSTVDMTGTVKSKSDLAGFWAHDSMVGKMGNAFESYTTFDAAAKKWHRVMVDNMGGMAMGNSDGMKDMKMDFAMDAMGPMGAMMVKDHVDMSDAKNGAKFFGERSMDKGKTWSKDYEVVCKK